MEDNESFKEKSFSDGELSISKFKKKYLCGNGMYKRKNGTIYMGDFVDGKITGKGVMLWPSETKHEDKYFVSCSHGNYRILTMDDYIDKFVCKIFNDNKDYTWSDGIIYEGDWIDGKMTGKGVMIWPSGTKYEGEFFENCRHGHGTLTKSNGDVYIGKFKKQFLHGNGKYIWSNGTIYEGNWVKGNMSGKGLITWASGGKYEGEFSENCRHGNGTQTWKNGNIYIGNWKKDKADGRGIMKWANGDVFDGCWSNGLVHGYGVYRFANGDVYIGNFKSNIRHGNGKYTWLSGKIYEGDWIDGEITGKGLIKWPSQTKYERQFSSNHLHNHDTLTKPTFNVYADECKTVYSMSYTYEGSWKEGLPEGSGRCTWKNGNIYNGIWKKGKFDGSGIMMWNNGDIFDGCWSNGLIHGYGVYRFANGRVYVGTWSKGLKDGKGTLYYPYESKKPSLLKKLCTILNYKNPKSKINPSFSEKAPLSGRSKNSHHLCHKTINNDQFGMSCKVYEREYKEGVLIKEKILSVQKNHIIIKTKKSDNLSVKQAKKSLSKDIFQDLQSYYLKLILQLCTR